MKTIKDVFEKKEQKEIWLNELINSNTTNEEENLEIEEKIENEERIEKWEEKQNVINFGKTPMGAKIQRMSKNKLTSQIHWNLEAMYQHRK